MVKQCPMCGQAVSFEGNPFRPFCSDRCKLIDLDNWLSERYRIKTTVTERNTPAEADDKRTATEENHDG